MARLAKIESQVGIWNRQFCEAKHNAIKFAVCLVVASLQMTIFQVQYIDAGFAMDAIP
jgi:hypothetical protein